MRYENELVGSHKIYYGLCRGKAKGRRTQAAGWIREQQDGRMERRGEKGPVTCNQAIVLFTFVIEPCA